MDILELYKNKDCVYRILSIKPDKVLVLDCIKLTMPYWIELNVINTFECVGTDLFNLQSITKHTELTNKDKKQIQHTFNIIAPIIPFIDDVFERNEMINKMSEKYKLSKQTIRNYLCKYLAYQDLSCLLKHQHKKKELSQDEKNFRYILNKYFYTSAKRSLYSTYLHLLREKYTDSNGQLIDKYPKFHRFKYYYYNTRKMDNYLISREGRFKYDRDYKPLLGDSRNYFNVVGFGECDGTIADIWLVDENNNLVGRPQIVACVDGFSSLLLGYAIGYKGGIYLLRDLMRNVNCNKVEYCRKFGIEIEVDEWPSKGIPMTLITDRGKEYLSENYSQLIDIGVDIINLRQYTPNEKGMVEQFFNILQNYFKQYLISKGIVRKDASQRGSPDYRKEATLTIEEFNKVLIHCIIHYNSKRILKNIPYRYVNKIKPYACDLFKMSLTENPNTFIQIEDDLLIKVLLPRTNGMFRRNGLIVNKLRYRALNYTNEFLSGGNVIVAYNPDNVGYVYLIDNGEYVKFELIDAFFDNKNIEEVNKVIDIKKELINKYQEESVLSEINLGLKINSIVNMKKSGNVNVKNVRETKSKIIKKEHMKRENYL